jgi:hypothetical protein
VGVGSTVVEVCCIVSVTLKSQAAAEMGAYGGEDGEDGCLPTDFGGKEGLNDGANRSCDGTGVGEESGGTVGWERVSNRQRCML